MYESSIKETEWVCIKLACLWRPRAFEEPHRGNIQSKFYNEKFPLVYESDNIGDSLSWISWCYFQAQVWQKDSNIIPSLFFSHFFIFLFFYLGIFSFFGLFFFSFGVSSRLVGEWWSPSSFPHLGQWSNNEDHHTFIYLQLKNYNSILRTRYDSIWMPPVVYRDMQWLMSDIYERFMNRAFTTNTMLTTWSC